MHPTTAKVISVVLHPALIPTYLFVILLFSTSIVPYQNEQKWLFLGAIFFFTFLCPVLGFFYFLKAKYISSMSMPDRDERVAPFVFVSLLYLLITYVLFKLPLTFDILGLIMLAISFVLVLVSAITLVHKVSVHAAGVSGGLGIFLGLQYKYEHEDFLYPVLLFILLVGVVMSARLALKAHTSTELITGASLGLLTTFGVLLFL